jgi:ATP-dependent Clp protease ATP-binding subunit ClpA
MEAIRKLFSPEFRNRLDAVVQFKSLDQQTIIRVVDKLILELEAQLQDKLVTLELDDEARQWIAERGYDAAMGARPMARVIQEFIKRPLAEELLFGKLTAGGHIRVGVSLDGNALVLETQENRLPVPAGGD